jgi:AcrR family transcriptional regulator
VKAGRIRDRRATERELKTALETLLQKDVSKVTILAVAKEAAVSSALIHNR